MAREKRPLEKDVSAEGMPEEKRQRVPALARLYLFRIGLCMPCADLFTDMKISVVYIVFFLRTYSPWFLSG